MNFSTRPMVRATLAATAVLSVMGSATSAQESVEEFYSGRTIEMIIAYSPGGGYDQYARLVARFLGRHIPGNPSIIPQNMPGAGSLLAANYIANVAPQDGTILGTVDQAIALSQAIGDERTNDFDVSQFNYIGTPILENNVMITWHTSPVSTVEEAREIAVSIGGTGSSTSVQYPMIMNDLVGTQFEIISGYPGGNDVNYAMESGEVDGRGSVNWSSLVPLGWYQDGLVNVIVQVGPERSPDLPDIPLLFELAENEEDETLLRTLSATVGMGRPIMTTPNVPADRLQALRDAFDQMVVDPEFIAAAEAEGLSVIPVSGEVLQQTTQDILNTPEDIAQRLREYLLAPS